MPNSFAKALLSIEQSVTPLQDSESLPLLHAINRIASIPLFASFELPKKAMSLKDGYGIPFGYHSSVPLEDTLRIKTGASLPCDIVAIIPEEEAVILDNCLHIPLHVKPHYNIKQQGEDIAHEECIIHAYERLHPYKITALAAQGITHIDVLKKPKMAIVSIGNTLVALGETLQEDTLYNTNAISLAARAIELGAEIISIEMCEEDEKTILETLVRLSGGVDLIISTGAMSSNDVMCSLLQNTLFDILLQECNISPARPSALSFLHHTPILNLPGLPLSAMLGFELLGVPLLRALQHQNPLLPPSFTRINQTELTCKESCVSAIPGFSDGTYFVSAPHHEAGRLNALSQCNGYILVQNKEKILVEERVSFIPFA